MAEPSTALQPDPQPALPPSRRFAVPPSVYMLVVVLIWGINFSATKLAFRDFDPLAFTGVRFALSSALLVLVLWKYEGTLRLPPGALGRLALLGIIGNSIYQTLFVIGLSRTTATNSSLVLASMPAMVAALGAATGTERLTRDGRRGLILASLGVLLVGAAKGAAFSMHTLGGDVMTLVAVVCWAVFTLGVRRFALPVSTLAITAWTTILGTPLLVLAGLPAMVETDWRAVSGEGWGALLYSSVLSLVVAYILWNRSIAKVGTNRTAVFACVTPLVAMTSAMLLLGERPRPIQLVGGAMILAGVLLSQRRAALPVVPWRGGGGE